MLPALPVEGHSLHYSDGTCSRKFEQVQGAVQKGHPVRDFEDIHDSAAPEEIGEDAPVRPKSICTTCPTLSCPQTKCRSATQPVSRLHAACVSEDHPPVFRSICQAFALLAM